MGLTLALNKHTLSTFSKMFKSKPELHSNFIKHKTIFLLQILQKISSEDKMKTGILWAQVISAWDINIQHFYSKFINCIWYSLIISDIPFKRVMELYLGKRLIYFKGFLTYFKNVFLIYLPFNSYFNNLNSNYYCQGITGNFTFH